MGVFNYLSPIWGHPEMPKTPISSWIFVAITKSYLRCSDAVLQFVEMPSLFPKIYLYIYIYKYI